MIPKSESTIGLFVCLFLTICVCKQNSNTEILQRQYKYEYHQQTLNFNNLWNDDQFQQKNENNKNVKFEVNQKEGVITLKTQGKLNQNLEKINFQNLEIQAEDAQKIQSIILINQKSAVFLIRSKYFTIIYSALDNKIFYQKIGMSSYEESYLFHSSLLWIFSHPNNNIVLLRVFDCHNNQLLKANKFPVKEKVQFISEIKSQNDVVIIKFLTFSRNYLQYRFDSKNIALLSSKIIETHNFEYEQKQIKQVQVHLNKKIHDIESQNSLQNFIYQVSFGYFGKVFQSSTVRDVEPNYDLDVFDCDKNLIFKLNEGRNQSELVSFGSVLIPTRTPVFISKSDQEKLIPFDQALNKSRTIDTMPLVDFKLYGIKSKNLQIMKGKTGLYRLLPDAKVHFMAFDSKFLTFYPKENVNPDQYYIVRTAKGGIAMKGNQIKGIFEETPVQNINAIELRHGYVKDQIYHEQTTNGIQVMPGIFEAHTIHKGLFVYPRKNRIDLITSLSGQSLLSHYLSIKGGYEYSTSFIQNNQFWVLEHKANNPPIITKYQLFLNSSTPKNLLSIKRTYDFPIKGRITRVQKCIDYFYYFTYITDDKKYGIARIHHALMSNRQTLPDQKYSGAFEKMMVIPNIQRNKKIKVTSNEQQLLIVELKIDESSFGNWKQLELKHQYKILPIRVYSYKNQYFILNLRIFMLNAFDSQIKLARQSIYSKILLLSVCTAVLLSLGLFIVLSSKNKVDKKAEKDDISAVKQSQNPKKDKKE